MEKNAINYKTPRLDKNTRYVPISVTLCVWDAPTCKYVPYLEEGVIVSFKNSLAAKKYSTENNLSAIVSYTNVVPEPIERSLKG